MVRVVPVARPTSQLEVTERLVTVRVIRGVPLGMVKLVGADKTTGIAATKEGGVGNAAMMLGKKFYVELEEAYELIPCELVPFKRESVISRELPGLPRAT